MRKVLAGNENNRGALWVTLFSLCILGNGENPKNLKKKKNTPSSFSVLPGLGSDELNKENHALIQYTHKLGSFFFKRVFFSNVCLIFGLRGIRGNSQWSSVDFFFVV